MQSGSAALAVKLLGQPASVLATEKFEKTYFPPERLIRISAYQTGEPYFGTSGYNRFDAPGARAGHPQYGVCYFGTHLEVAMAESILHDEVPVDGSFQPAPSQIDRLTSSSCKFHLEIPLDKKGDRHAHRRTPPATPTFHA